jgi:rubrerythrin
MDEKTKKKLMQLLEIFGLAMEEERKAQELYLKCKEEYGGHADFAALFDWLHGQEVSHEKALKEKYKALKAELAAK